MATRADICGWRHGPLGETAEALRTISTSLADLEDEAQLALARLVSEAPSIDAARDALGRCSTSHGELLKQVSSLGRATSEACDGVAVVEKKVVACQDYAADHPLLTLHPDGTVSTDAQAAGGSGGTASGLTAGQLQEQADELETMVSATLLYANEVDGSFANSLTTSATPNPQPGPSPAPPVPPDHSSSPTRPSRGSPDTSRSGRLRDGGPDDSEGDGDNDSSTGLGQPVPGEHADMPGVDPWQYPGDSPGEGSGQHGQRNPTMHDYAVHELAATAAEACAPAWPDASANPRHYLENTGTPQGVDVDGMLHDIPSLHDGSQADAEVMTGKAVEDAQASGATGPVTYPFNTPWTPEGPDDSENWFYATGNYQYATDGTVTVYPPTDDNSEWTYTYDYRVHMADRYNWDGNKSTNILGMNITDAELQELHRADIAQEYDLTGESSVRSGRGSK